MDNNYYFAPQLDTLLNESIVESFPELKDKGIRMGIAEGKQWGGAMGHLPSPLVVLFKPRKAEINWALLKAITAHELSHFLGKDSEGTRQVFYERADKASQKLFLKMEIAGMLRCEDEDSLNVSFHRRVIKRLSEWFGLRR